MNPDAPVTKHFIRFAAYTRSADLLQHPQTLTRRNVSSPPVARWRLDAPVAKYYSIQQSSTNTPMKKLLFSMSIATLLTASSTLAADDLAALAGKWSTKKTNEQGQSFTQTLEIKKDKFTFQILGNDSQVVIHAVGDVKLEKLGPFSSAQFTHIRGGNSPGDLTEVDEEYACVYVLDGDTWTMATNFEKQRDQQKPTIDVYRRVKAPTPGKETK